LIEITDNQIEKFEF